MFGLDRMNKREVNKLAYDIIAAAIKVHNALGPGLLESVYERCIIHELTNRGFSVANQVTIPIVYDGLELDADLRLDILVNNLIVVEIKATQEIHPIHQAQILSYMKLLKLPKGILINFHTDRITDSAKHFVNQLFKDLPS